MSNLLEYSELKKEYWGYVEGGPSFLASLLTCKILLAILHTLIELKEKK
jgi:hypothetical protein